MKGKEPTPREYQEFLSEIRQQIANAQQSAARAVNAALILLYWDLGRRIVETQTTKAWGDQVIPMLAKDLKRDFPDQTGYSERNLWYMREFWSAYSRPEFLQQAVAELDGVKGGRGKQPHDERVPVGVAGHESDVVLRILVRVPWGQHVLILDRTHSGASRLFYLRATAAYGWTRNVLNIMLKARTFERSQAEGKAHNFPTALPEDLAEQAHEALMSSYNLDFLDVKTKVHERALERGLVDRITEFMLHLGYGFCFIGRQYRLEVGDEDFYIDLLFYHRFLKSLIAIELKTTRFTPEDAGKMDFYLNVLNERVRAPDDNPSIGMILCSGKNDVVVEFSLKSKGNPIGVAPYTITQKLPKELEGKLPTAEELRKVLQGASDAQGGAADAYGARERQEQATDANPRTDGSAKGREGV